MEQYIEEIRKYLPLNFTDPENKRYIEYLTKAYQENIDAEKYQFAFIAFHMLYMTAVYKTTWLLKKREVKDIDKIMSGAISKMVVNSPFDFSPIPEKQIFDVFACLNIHSTLYRGFSSLVDKRDGCTHANGIILYDKTKVEGYIKDELEACSQIHTKTGKVLSDSFKDFIEENWDPEDRLDTLATITEFIDSNYLSFADLRTITTIDIEKLYKLNSKESLLKSILYIVFLGNWYLNYEGDKDLYRSKVIPIIQQFDALYDDDLRLVLKDELFALYQSSETNVPFISEKVTTEHWAYLYIKDAIEKGFFDREEILDPEEFVTRGETAKLMFKVAKYAGVLSDIDTVNAPNFSDVADNSEFYPYIATLSKKNLLSSYRDASGKDIGKFGPADFMTRVETVKGFINAGGVPNKNTPVAPFPNLNPRAWYIDYLSTAYNWTIIDPNQDGTFHPDDPVTKAELAKIIYGALNPRDRSVGSQT